MIRVLQIRTGWGSVYDSGHPTQFFDECIHSAKQWAKRCGYHYQLVTEQLPVMPGFDSKLDSAAQFMHYIDDTTFDLTIYLDIDIHILPTAPAWKPVEGWCIGSPPQWKSEQWIPGWNWLCSGIWSCDPQAGVRYNDFFYNYHLETGWPYAHNKQVNQWWMIDEPCLNRWFYEKHEPYTVLNREWTHCYDGEWEKDAYAMHFSSTNKVRRWAKWITQAPQAQKQLLINSMLKNQSSSL